LNNLTQPIISKYTQIVDDKLDFFLDRVQPLTGFSISQINDLILMLRTRIRKLKWDHTGNIFNHLVSQWLIQNLPVHEKISSFETFVQSLAFYKPFNMTIQTHELYLINFYKVALSVWIQLKEPSLDDVQLAVLEIVAKAINLNMKLEREIFAQALYDILLVLINKKNEIITEDNFVKLMRNYLGILWKEQPSYYKACSEFYEFAKHFILIDFPNKKHSHLMNFHAILQGKIAYFNDHILTILEKGINHLYVRVVNKKKELDDDEIYELEPDLNEMNGDKNKINMDFQNYLSQLIIANSNFTRTKVLLSKFYKISQVLAIKYWNEMKKYEIIGKFDGVFKKMRIYDVFNFSFEKIKFFQFEFLLPKLEKAQIYIIFIKDSILIKFENCRNLDRKTILNSLKNQIKFLRESMLIFYEGLIEMKFNKFSLETIYQKIKTDIITIDKEINECKKKNNENMSKSMILYNNTIKFFQKKKESNCLLKKIANQEKNLEEI